MPSVNNIVGIFGSILITTLIISVISLVCGILLLWNRLLSEKFSIYFVSFAAGVMLSTALLDLLPEALENNHDHNLFFAILLGIVVFFFMERFLLWFHHHDDTHNAKPSSILILVGDGFHNFIDGIVIAATYLANPTVGVITTLAIIAHEIPQEMADLSILINGGMNKKKALSLNFLSALAAFGGAIVGYYFIRNVENLLPLFIAFTVGMFIYIACSDLIPDMHHNFKKRKTWNQSVPFIIGIILMYSITTLLGGQH